jgi:5-methylcytosine-specific restriction enzyme subunit McrC
LEMIWKWIAKYYRAYTLVFDMRKTITVYEHETISIGDTLPSHTKSITLRDAQALSTLEKSQGRELFRWGYKKLTFRQWVGVIGTSNLIIEILPKTDKMITEQEWIVRDLLARMLSISGMVPYRINLSASTDTIKSDLFEIFIHVFIEAVNKLVRKGVVTDYKQYEGNEAYLKGKLLPSQQLGKNLIRRDRFFVRFDDYSADTVLNRIIKATILKIKYFASSLKTSHKLQMLLQHFEGINEKQFKLSDFQSIFFSRKETSYVDVINICRLIWNGESPGLQKGDTQTFSLLFDMNQLFERTVRNRLIQFENFLTEKVVVERTRNSRWLFSSNNNRVGKLIPDNVLLDAITGQPLAILDTKWKILGIDLKSVKVSQDDLYQMYAYLREYQIASAILLYPHTGQNFDCPEYLNLSFKEKAIKLTIKRVNISKLVSNNPDQVKEEINQILLS